MEQINLIINSTGKSIPLFSKIPFSTLTSAVQEKNLMGDDTVKLNVVTTSILNVGKGDYIVVDGEKYTVRTPVTRSVISDRHYEYEITLYGVMYDLMKCLYRNADNSGKSSKTSFDLTYTLREFVKVIINNMSRDYPGKWSFDENNCPETEARTVTFNNQNCLQVLQTLCSKDCFNYDFRITQSGGQSIIHIGKFGSKINPPGGGEYFEYGKGNGIYQLKEEKVDDVAIKTRLWVEGGSTNIKNDYRDYAGRLQLPYPKRKNTKKHTLRDGTIIAVGQETIGISDDAKRYHEDAALAAKIGSDEDYKAYDEIYPTRTGTVSKLGDSVLEFYDDSMDFDLFAKDDKGQTLYLIDGTSAKLTFVSGKLAGHEFELEAKVGYDHTSKKFTIIEYQDERGQKFPDGTNTAFQISVGDKYKLTDIVMPDAIVKDAEEDLWYESIQDFEDAKQARVKYTLTLDRIYMLRNVSDDVTAIIFNVGDYVPVKDTRFDIEKSIRVTKVSRNLLLKQDYAITI